MGDEKQLIAALQAGEPAAAEQLVERYADRLLRAAYLLTGDYHLAQDMVQESLLTTVQKIARFQGDSSLYTWLYRILLNRCRAERRRRVPSPTARPAPTDIPLREGDAACCAANPAHQLLAQERAQTVTQAVLGLPALYREVITLFYYEELSINQMAALLGERPGTLKSRLHRARKLLAEALRKEETVHG